MQPESRITRRSFMTAGSALAGGVLLASCGSSKPTSGAGSNPSTTDSAALTSTAEIEQAARAEGGTLLFYTFSSDLVTALGGGFSKKYPWANVQTFVGQNPDISDKLITESVSKSPTADVFMLPPTWRQTLMENDIVAATTIPSESAVSKELLDSSGYGHPVYQLVITLIYNTNLVKSPPTDAYDMADPAWKGKFAFDEPQNIALGATWLASKRQQWGDDKWKSWLQALKDNNALITNSGGDSYSAVLQGGRAIGVDSTNDVLSQAKGAPVAAIYNDNDVIRFVQLAWLTKRAAHPQTGRLFLDWVISEEGQQAMAGTSRSPVLNIDVPTALAKILPSGTQLLPTEYLNDFYTNTSAYVKIYDSIWPT
jgi:iron(III) transport system substrate-binding protein